MTVYLVGAGPGDPDLLTLKAAKLLGRADVVVHDRLVPPAVLELVAPWAELVDVGKTPGSLANSQDEINDILVDRGRCADVVVRLKGGDPHIFGRAAEEAAALAQANIGCIVVPGISSSVAAPAAAGIPVTLRGVSSGFTVVTAHQDPDNERILDWDALAKLGTTLVVLMGARRASIIADRLIAGGLDPSTPAAAVIDASLPTEEIRRGRLHQLGELARRSPAVLVIGDVAAVDSRTITHQQLTPEPNPDTDTDTDTTWISARGDFVELTNTQETPK